MGESGTVACFKLFRILHEGKSANRYSKNVTQKLVRLKTKTKYRGVSP
jgi:hypothetical protein